MAGLAVVFSVLFQPDLDVCDLVQRQLWLHLLVQWMITEKRQMKKITEESPPCQSAKMRTKCIQERGGITLLLLTLGKGVLQGEQTKREANGNQQEAN